MADIKKSKYTEEQIIGFIKQAEAGMQVKELVLTPSHGQVFA
jgi:hypothetical protein